MRCKKIISLMLSLFIVSAGTQTLAVHAETGNTAAVSGYVSFTDGLELVSGTKTPTIYVDSADYEGVVRAVDDLKDDIKTVTGVEPTVTNEIKKKFLAGGGTAGFAVDEEGMWVGLYQEDDTENA